MKEDNRIVALIDMDCFYVQVERHKNPNLIGKPLMLCQHGSSNGVALSISYEAKALGVGRRMNVKEAKEVCPEIEIVRVPRMEHLDKGDLTDYKNASDSIFDVMIEFCGSNIVIEKASVDEAYLNLTGAAIESILQDEIFQSLLENPEEKIPELLPSSYAIYYGEKSFEIDDRVACLKHFIEVCKTSKNDMALLAGNFAIERLRKEIFDRTGYHCSAGVSNNKMLAKLIAGKNKPKAQTVLPKSEIIAYLDQVEIQSVRGFGGKFGKRIVEKLGIQKVGDIHRISLNDLKDIFPDSYMRIIDLSNGICSEEVNARIMPKSLGVSKNLRDISKKEIMQWAHGLTLEFLRRLESDQEKFKRIATHFEVGANFVDGSHMQKSFKVPFYEFDTIYKNVKGFFISCYKTENEEEWKLQINHMGMNASKFEPLQKGVQRLSAFFTRRVSNNVDDSDNEVEILNIKKADKAEEPEAEVLPKKKPRIDKSSKSNKAPSKKKRPKKEVNATDPKQLTLNFLPKPPRINLNIPIESIIELSSDSDSELKKNQATSSKFSSSSK